MEADLFSPRVWGWSDTIAIPADCDSVFPTRVGMVRGDNVFELDPGSFPHACGDGPRQGRVLAGYKAFSPRVWGWSEHIALHLPKHPVFPTRVGMVRLAARKDEK